MTDRVRATLQAAADRGRDDVADDVFNAAVAANRRRRLTRRVGTASCALLIALGGAAVVVAGDDGGSRTIETHNPPASSMSVAPSPTTGVVVLEPASFRFEPESVVRATFVEFRATGLRALAGRAITLWMPTPDGSDTASLGEGVIDDDGNVSIDVYVPWVIGHEYLVPTGRHMIEVHVDGAKPLATSMLIGDAEVGVDYAVARGYECIDFFWFDARRWRAEDPSDSSLRLPVNGLTMRLTDESHGFITSPETGPVALREATPEEMDAFDPEFFAC